MKIQTRSSIRLLATSASFIAFCLLESSLGFQQQQQQRQRLVANTSSRGPSTIGSSRSTSISSGIGGIGGGNILQKRSTGSLTQMSASSSLDEAISSWASDAGFGEVTSSSGAGSSGWASFRRVEVSQPPQPGMSFFVKTSRRSAKEMFEGEALGLRAMFECSQGEDDESLKIPEVFHWGDISDGGSFLVMEYLNLGGRGNEYALGRAMAQMHLADPTKLPNAGNPDGKFGFNLDNTIGGTPQPNPWTEGSTKEDWVAFFRDQRIGHQLQLAGNRDALDMWNSDIAPRLGALFDDLDVVKPSLLHGDLWSGNIGSANGKPSIYDPAVYWGHHEAEWGMSWCASFGAQFWEGYRSLIPESPGFRNRKPLYDAYHQLNHYNLFGGGYLGTGVGQLQQVKRILDKKDA